jgi:DNA end-binding protein Ku
MARAMWKGSISFGNQRLGVKMYSAIEDRSVRFHLLHKKDLAPVEQHIVRKDTGEDVEREDIRKAFSIGEDKAVVLQPEDLEKLVPPESRDIKVYRFVSSQAVDDQWYDRPYYLGPDEDTESYFALSQALEDTELIGISHWVMRNKRYVGALTSIEGYLTLTTMRSADQILKFTGVEPATSAKLLANELRLAEQLVSSISEDFAPQRWQNEYRQRLLEVIDAKARGAKLTPVRAKKKSVPVSLVASLKASIAAVREKKVA